MLATRAAAAEQPLLCVRHHEASVRIEHRRNIGVSGLGAHRDARHEPDVMDRGEGAQWMRECLLSGRALEYFPLVPWPYSAEGKTKRVPVARPKGITQRTGALRSAVASGRAGRLRQSIAVGGTTREGGTPILSCCSLCRQLRPHRIIFSGTRCTSRLANGRPENEARPLGVLRGAHAATPLRRLRVVGRGGDGAAVHGPRYSTKRWVAGRSSELPSISQSCASVHSCHP